MFVVSSHIKDYLATISSEELRSQLLIAIQHCATVPHRSHVSQDIFERAIVTSLKTFLDTAPESFAINQVKRFINQTKNPKYRSDFGLLCCFLQVITTAGISKKFNYSKRQIQRLTHEPTHISITRSANSKLHITSELAKQKRDRHLIVIGVSKSRENLFSKLQVERVLQPKKKRIFLGGIYITEDSFACKHGRIYSKYVRLPKIKRQRLKFDGQKTIELDIEACHVQCLYKIMSNRVDDMNEVEKFYNSRHTIYEDIAKYLNIERKDAKIKFLSYLNASKYSHKYKVIGDWLSAVYPCIHKEINNIKSKGSWTSFDGKRRMPHARMAQLLQLGEVTILRNIIQLLQESGVDKFITIHDSVIVKESDCECLKIAMQTAMSTFLNRKQRI